MASPAPMATPTPTTTRKLITTLIESAGGIGGDNLLDFSSNPGYYCYSRSNQHRLQGTRNRPANQSTNAGIVDIPRSLPGRLQGDIDHLTRKSLLLLNVDHQELTGCVKQG